jgi:cellulose synthase/poly-beta-1,6-N-acetylglucosamine synthase-like glycosyltransferase
MVLELIGLFFGFIFSLVLSFFIVLSIINFITAWFSVKPEIEYEDYFPVVSVIVRTWNDASVIERCILTYLNQNYPKKNYEIIIVDDGSTDDTKAICERYMKEGKIRYVRFDEHGVKAERIDYAIKNFSCGEIIVETDVDAVLPQNFLATMVKPYTDPKVGGVTGIVMCGNWYRNLLARIRAIEDFWHFCVTMYGRFRLTGQGFLYGGSKSYRRSAWEEVGGHQAKTLVEDAELAVSIMDKGYTIAIVKEAPIVQEEVETMEQYYSEQRRWVKGDLDVWKMHKKHLSKDYLNYFAMIANFSTDIVFLLSLVLMFLQPLFIIPIFINFISFIIGLWSFRAKDSFYIYALGFFFINPFLRLAIAGSLMKDKIIGRKVEWTKVWHYPTELVWPTK